MMLEYWDRIVLAIGGVVAFFTGRKLQFISEDKAKVDVDSQRIENLDKLLKIQNEQIDVIKAQFQSRIDNLSEYVKELENINLRLESLVKEQKEVIKEQSKSLNYYKSKCK